MQIVRVLQVVVSMDAGGIETMLMNYYRNIDKSKVQFDFLLHCKHKSHYEDEIEAMGGKIFRVPSYHPKEHIAYIKALKAFFKEHTEYKAVHSHIGFYSMYVLKAAKIAGISLRIAHSHCSNKFWRLDKTLPFRIKTRHGLKKQYTHVYGCSPEAAEYMAPGANYTVMNNAIDVPAFCFSETKRTEMRSSLGINNELLLGHVGRFTKEKNHSFILETFALLLKRNAEAKLLLIGAGKLLEETKAKAVELGINDNVIFTGVRKDIASLMCAMDIFIFPSKFEGFPVTLVEAQSSDLPCVISDTFSKTAVISDKVKILSLEDTKEKWVDEILDFDLSLPRRNNCKMMTEAELDIKSNAKKLQKVYLEAYGYGE